MCGKEFCNAYTELNDPFEQRLRFEEQVSLFPYSSRLYSTINESCFRSGRRKLETMRLKGSMRLSSTRTSHLLTISCLWRV